MRLALPPRSGPYVSPSSVQGAGSARLMRRLRLAPTAAPPVLRCDNRLTLARISQGRSAHLPSLRVLLAVITGGL